MIVEHPFDSNVKRMTTVWKFEKDDGEEQDLTVFTKGAVSVSSLAPASVSSSDSPSSERILDRCVSIGLNPATQTKLDAETREDIIAHMDDVSLTSLPHVPLLTSSLGCSSPRRACACSLLPPARSPRPRSSSSRR